MSEFKPPAHPMIEVDELGIWFADGSGNGGRMQPEEAIKLGLALMEHGLHQRELQKSQQPKEPTHD